MQKDAKYQMKRHKRVRRPVNSSPLLFNFYWPFLKLETRKYSVIFILSLRNNMHFSMCFLIAILCSLLSTSLVSVTYAVCLQISCYLIFFVYSTNFFISPVRLSEFFVVSLIAEFSLDYGLFQFDLLFNK